MRTIYREKLPPQRALEVAKRSSNYVVSSSVLVASKTRYRPLWTYQSMTFTDMNNIQEAQIVRTLSPRDRTSRQRKRREMLNRFERDHYLFDPDNMALSTSCTKDLLVEFVNRQKSSNVTVNPKKTLLRRLIPAVCFVAFLFLRCIHKPVPDTSPRHVVIEDFDDVIEIPAKRPNAFQAAKEYVKKDPNLFFILL